MSVNAIYPIKIELGQNYIHFNVITTEVSMLTSAGFCYILEVPLIRHAGIVSWQSRLNAFAFCFKFCAMDCSGYELDGQSAGRNFMKTKYVLILCILHATV